MKNQIVKFQGYSELPEGQEVILNEGERVRVETVNDDGSMVAYSLDRKDANDQPLGDQVFPEEVEATGDAADDPRLAEGAEAPKAKRTRSTGKKATTAKAGKATKAAGKNATKAEKKAEPVQREAKVPDADIIVITDTESVTNILNESDDAVAAAKSLVEQGERTDYTLGGVLHHIYSEGIHKGVVNEQTGDAYEGKRGFADFVEKELGVQYRRRQNTLFYNILVLCYISNRWS